MNKSLIALGSNTPSGIENIKECIQLIIRKVDSVSFSDIFMSEPEGTCKEYSYTNCVGEIITDLSFEQLNVFFKETEITLGRDNQSRQTGMVPIDIDIVTWNQDIIRPKDFNRNYFKHGLDLLKNRNNNLEINAQNQ